MDYKPSYPINIVDSKEDAYAWIDKLKPFISE